MNAYMKIAVGALTLWIMLFSTMSAYAQSTQVQGLTTWASQDSGATVCSFSQPGIGSCSGSWNIGWAWGTGKISGSADYGILKGNGVSTVAASQGTEAVDTNSVVTSSFNDLLSFPNLPKGTSAIISATVDLSGGSFVGSYPSSALGEAIVVLGNNASQCKVDGAGSCTASLTVVGGSGPVNFQLTLNLLAFADAPCCYQYETGMAEDLSYRAKITSLTITGSNGETYKIATASLHHYRAH
jgi:hypothetical protein